MRLFRYCLLYTSSTHNVPYGSKLYAADGDIVEKGKLIAKWDPFNAVIITEATGKIEFESVVENVTYKVKAQEHNIALFVSDKPVFDSAAELYAITDV